MADLRAVARLEKTRPNNASGMAIAGGRGVGKSNGMRLLALVPALLCPRDVVTVYVDYESNNAATAPPRTLIRDALRCAVDEELQLAPEATLESVLDAAKKSRRAVLLAVDAFESVYLIDEVWREFHTLATMYSPTLFMADSGSKVRAMIERRGHESDLRRWFPTAHPLPSSLNQDKLSVTPLLPFTTLEQYRVFARTRNVPLVGNVLSSNDGEVAQIEEDIVIAGLHARSGGRLRIMQRASHDDEPFYRLPPPESAELAVLEHLQELQTFRVGAADPFQTVRVSGQDVRRWLREWAKTNEIGPNDINTDINSMLDANLLLETESGEYTFGAYDLYRQLRERRPRVFFSLAWDQRELPSVASLRGEIDRRRVADTVICNDPAAADAMSKDGLAPWMRDLATPRVDHYVVILLSDLYVQRVMDGGGARTELEAVAAVIKAAPAKPDVFKHIVVVSLEGTDKLAEWRKESLVAVLLDHIIMVYTIPPGRGDDCANAVNIIADRILGAAASPAPAPSKV